MLAGVRDNALLVRLAAAPVEGAANAALLAFLSDQLQIPKARLDDRHRREKPLKACESKGHVCRDGRGPAWARVMDADLLVHDLDSLYTCAGSAPRRGAAQRDAGRRDRASIAALNGRIVWAGPADLADRHVRLD